MIGRKGKDGTRKETPPEKGDIKAFLGAGSHFEGKLNFEEIVRLDGTFKGEVTSRDTLIVGKTADLQGEISVGTLVLSGRFKGNIKAANRVELRSPAEVEGTIEAPVLLVEEGVIFNGTLSMKKEGQTVAEGEKKVSLFSKK